jgi:PAS domain S-box-containing protein
MSSVAIASGAVRPRSAFRHTTARSMRPLRAIEPLPEGLGLAQLFLHTSDAAVVSDVDTGRIVLWNPAAQRLFGYTAAEAIGQSMHMLIPPDVARVHYEALAHYRRTDDGDRLDSVRPMNVSALTKSGDEIRVELSFVPIDERAAPRRYVLALLRDTSERSRADVQALEASRADTARAAAERKLQEQQGMLNALASLRPERTNLVPLVAEAVAAARARSSQHKLNMAAPQGLTATVDPRRFTQMVETLIDSAMRRNPSGCWIDVDLRRPLGAIACLEVRDSGRAVSDDELEELLKATDADGSLAVIRWLVEQHGGTLTLNSGREGGLQATVTLPTQGGRAPRSVQ